MGSILLYYITQNIVLNAIFDDDELVVFHHFANVATGELVNHA